MALPTIDAGFPKHVFSSAGPASSSIASITTTGPSLMVAVLHIDSPGAVPTVTSAGGLTWTEQVHESAVGTAAHWVSIWTAPSAGALSAVTITFSYTSSNAGMLDIYSVSGSAASPIGASKTQDSNASAAAPQVIVTALAANSLIIGGFDNFSGAGSLTALANTTKDQSDATFDEMCSGHASTVAVGNITVGGSAPNAANSCCVALEILGGGSAVGLAQSQRGPSRNPRLAVRGPGSRFRHATWASTDTGTTSSVDLGGGNIAGAAVLTADLSLAEALAGAIAGQATLAADLRLAEALAGSISGQGTLTADLREAIALAGNLAGAATLTGNLSLAVALAGTIAGQATLSASLVEAIALSGNIAGIASLAATLALAEALAGNIAGQATLTADVQTGTPLAGHVTGAALVTADLSLAVALAGNITGTATITGRLSLPGGAVTYTVFVFDD